MPQHSHYWRTATSKSVRWPSSYGRETVSPVKRLVDPHSSRRWAASVVCFALSLQPRKRLWR